MVRSVSNKPSARAKRCGAVSGVCVTAVAVMLLQGCGTDEVKVSENTPSSAPSEQRAVVADATPPSPTVEAPSALVASAGGAATGETIAAPAADPAGAYARGLELSGKGDLKEAVAAFRSVLAAVPEHHGARVNLARALVRMKQTSEALAQLDAASEKSAARDDVWNVRGLALLEEGRLEEAGTAFAKAIEINPENLFAFNNQGLCLIRAGRFDEAVDPLERASTFEGAPAYVYNNLGVALERSGRTSAAHDAFAQAVARGHGWAGVSLGRVDAQLAAAAPASPETPDSLSQAIVEEQTSVEGTTAEAVRVDGSND